jgi:K+-transporting ATPase A subunit
MKRNLALAVLGVASLLAVLFVTLGSGGGGSTTPTTTTESCASLAAASTSVPSVPAGAEVKALGTNGGGCFNR